MAGEDVFFSFTLLQRGNLDILDSAIKDQHLMAGVDVFFSFLQFFRGVI
jgi:hypothetical protein